MRYSVLPVVGKVRATVDPALYSAWLTVAAGKALTGRLWCRDRNTVAR
jgi:hypothetical protein